MANSISRKPYHVAIEGARTICVVEHNKQCFETPDYLRGSVNKFKEKLDDRTAVGIILDDWKALQIVNEIYERKVRYI